jgi:hypothetical protein
MAKSLLKVAVGLACAVWLSGCGIFGDRSGWETQKDPAPGMQTPHDGGGPAPLPVVNGMGR